MVLVIVREVGYMCPLALLVVAKSMFFQGVHVVKVLALLAVKWFLTYHLQKGQLEI